MAKFDINDLEAGVDELEKELTEGTKEPAAEAPTEKAPEAPKEEEKPADEPEPEEDAAEEAEDGDDEDDGEERAEEPKPEERQSKTPKRIAEKLRAKKAEERAHQLEIENARLKGQQEGSQKKPEPEAEQPDPEPDAVNEPLAHMQWKLRQVEKRDAEREKKYQELESKHQRTEAEKLWMETDKQMAEDNKAYGPSMKFLRESLRKQLKEHNPDVPASKIEAAAKQAEYNLVSKLAAQDLSIDTYFIGEAIKSGFNPYAEQAKPDTAPKVPERPKSDPREVKLHKKQAGSIATVPTGGGKGRMTAGDIAQMSTMDDIFKLGKLGESDWKALAADASKGA